MFAAGSVSTSNMVNSLKNMTNLQEVKRVAMTVKKKNMAESL